MTDNSQAANKRRRARKPNGAYKGDNPETTRNEAWEPIELDEEVSSGVVGYSVKTKVEGTSKPTAGKYGKKPKIRPTFGTVTSTSF